VKGVRQALQVMLEDLIDDMEMVEDTYDDRRLLGIQPGDVRRDHIVKAVVRPLLAADKVGIGLYAHESLSFRRPATPA
jgi:hypothetical protein